MPPLIPRTPAPDGAELPALLTRRRVQELLAQADVRPAKARGQNFLADPNTARKIVRVAGVEPGDRVLEIGPGLGSLTLALLRAGATVEAVEIDAGVAGLLAAVLGGAAGVRVHIANALTADLPTLAPGAHRFVANLPYNIAVPLVLRVLTTAPAVEHLTFMVQREVGERLAAGPGERAYGAPSAKVAALGAARVAASVSRHVFVPEPHVDSVLVTIERHEDPRVTEVGYGAYARVVDAAFGQRRKTLRNALQTLGIDAGTVEQACLSAGVAPGERAERLGVTQFSALTAALR